MIRLECPSYRTLAEIPHHIVVCINTLKARISEIARQIFSYCLNRSQNDYVAIDTRQSINRNAWTVMSAFLESEKKTFQFSVSHFLTHFAEAARGASVEDQNRLAKALYMPDIDWPSSVFSTPTSGVDLINNSGTPTSDQELITKQANEKTIGQDTVIDFSTTDVFQLKLEDPFYDHDTEKGNFTNSDGTNIKLDMMKNITEKYRFAQQDNMDIMEFSLKGDAFSLLIFLPTLEYIRVPSNRKEVNANAVKKTAKAKASLNIFKKYFYKTKPEDVLNNLNLGLKNKEREVLLPKKVIEFDTDFLRDIPKHEAVEIVKSINATNLPTNINQPVIVKEMRAKTKVEWDHEPTYRNPQESYGGTEAYIYYSQFIVDRPYAWMVASKENNKLSTICSMGVVGNLQP